MSVKKVIFWIGVLILAIVVYSTIPSVLYKEERFSIPIDSGIERSISMGGLENKFVEMESVGFGGAGAGGQGTAQMRAISPRHFLELAGNEKIYSSEVIESREKYTKTYWAFIENRAGLLIYEESYYFSGYVIESHTANGLNFYKNNGGFTSATQIVLPAIIVMLSFLFTLTPFYKSL